MGAVLVVDDHPSALAGLAYALRDRWEVILAATVGEALAALRGPLAIVAVVLDLRLREPAAPLHRELLLRETPVVVVSGMEADAAMAIADVWGWPALLKPVADADLLAAVERAARCTDARATDSTTSTPAATTETEPMHDTSPQRATTAPDDPDSPPSPRSPDTSQPISRVTGVTAAPASDPLPAPPDAPDLDSVSPLAATNPTVAIAEARFRTVRRVVASVCLTGLAVLFELRGHTVPLPLVIGLTALGIGLAGAVSALKKRPAVAAGGAAGLALLALGGTALGLDEANAIATLGAGAIPVVDLLADRVRGA